METKTPFTQEQFENLKYNQDKWGLLTCMGHDGCTREINEGLLIIQPSGMVCPCGKYKQMSITSMLTEDKL